jgi:hypothetical protein
MTPLHISIEQTEEIEKVMAFLKKQYILLDESEICKLALSEFFNNQIRYLSLDDPSHPFYSESALEVTNKTNNGVVTIEPQSKGKKSTSKDS